MHFFIINTKNYPEASGRDIQRLAEALTLSNRMLKKRKSRVRIYLAVPAFALWQLSTNFSNLKFLAQHLDNQSVGSTTGYLVPEIAKLFGASGSLLNHSEHRAPLAEVRSLVNRLKLLRMISVVCARSASEVPKFAALDPDFVAIEPPELIGSGRAVSTARPELISDSKRALRGVAQTMKIKTRLLCGAGIVQPLDVKRSVELGAEGILVASGVVKSKNWSKTIDGLAREL